MQLWQNLSGNVRLAVIIFSLAVVWLLSGVFGGKHAEKTVPEAQIPQVAYQVFSARDYRQEVKIIGRTEPERKSLLAAQVAGEVEATPVIEGAAVKTGDILVQLEVSAREDAVASAKAALAAAEKQVVAARKLHAEGFQSDVSLATREAEVASTRERLTQAQEELQNTSVRAPFNGLVERVYVEVGDYATPGAPLVDLLGTDQFLIVGFAAQQERSLVQPGAQARAVLATGDEVVGTVRFVARDAQPDTRTYRVEVAVNGAAYPDLATGMTADVYIPGKQVTAHGVPHAALVLNDDGAVGVMLANSETAVFTPVEILADSPTEAWVAGLPEAAPVITRGQTAVKDGSPVRAALISGSE